MDRWGKGCLFGGIPVYLLAVAALVVTLSRRRENLDSPATASRDVYGFREGHFGLLAKPAKTKSDAVWPPEVVMEIPRRLEGGDGAFLLGWTREERPGVVPAPQRWRNSLHEGEAIELVAFATWVPGPDDPIDSDSWEAELRFRDSGTLSPLTGPELDRRGVPPSFHRLAPPDRYHTPVLRLLFRTSGMEHPHSPGLLVGDARTGAKVSYEFSPARSSLPRCQAENGWMAVDAALLCWHDTPLNCRVRFLTGVTELAELEPGRGAQAAFGDLLRVQWLELLENQPESVRIGFALPGPNPTGVDPPPDLRDLVEHVRSHDRSDPGYATFSFGTSPEPGPVLAVRCSSFDLLRDHCGLLAGDRILRDWREVASKGRITIASLSGANRGDGPARLVFTPGIIELDFSIAALPDLPNPRGTEDLFDTLLPRITLPTDPDAAEDHLTGYIAAATQLAWKHRSRWDDHPPAGFPPDGTFRNTTPQQLLDWYLDQTRGAKVRYDRDGLVLHFNEERENRWTELIESIGRWLDSL